MDRALFITDRFRMLVSLVWDAMGKVYLIFMIGDENNEVSVSTRQAPVRNFLRERMSFDPFVHSRD